MDNNTTIPNAYDISKFKLSWIDRFVACVKLTVRDMLMLGAGFTIAVFVCICAYMFLVQAFVKMERMYYNGMSYKVEPVEK